MDSTRLGHVARRQNGLFTRAQARACGFSAAHVARRLRDGTWTALDDQVLMLPSATVTPALRDLAAHLTIRGSVLAGISAARRWWIEVPPAAPHVIVERRVRPVAGVRIERAGLGARDVTRVDGIPTTTRDRTVFDCLRLLPVDNAACLLDRALQQGWVTLPDITARLGAATGRRGVEQVCRLVRAAADGSRSAAERRATRLLRRAGITGWTANAAIHDDNRLPGKVFDGLKKNVNRPSWIKRRQIYRVPKLSFKKTAKKFKLVFSSSKVLWLQICAAAAYEEERPGITARMAEYNAIIQEIYGDNFVSLQKVVDVGGFNQDHTHFTPCGHQAIAEALIEKMTGVAAATSTAPPPSAREEAYD